MHAQLPWCCDQTQQRQTIAYAKEGLGRGKGRWAHMPAPHAQIGIHIQDIITGYADRPQQSLMITLSTGCDLACFTRT